VAVHKIEAISFPNAQGLTLFGTLHAPARPVAGLPVVVLLSPGVKMRVGPGRLYVPLTQMLLERGFSVLRFDFFGLGDSEGELAETLLADVYNNIEVGRYVDDTLQALAWLRQRGHQKFIVGGLCGGAITALLAAQRDPAVEALLSLGMTVTLASNAAVPGKYLTRVQLDRRRDKYLRKIFSPQAWLRFLSFKSEYSVIWHSMKRLWAPKKAPPPSAAPQAVGAPGAPPQPIEQRGNANPLFPPAYFAFLERGGHALMMFSEKDRLQSEYEEKFAEPFAPKLAPYLAQIHKHVIPNSNHVMSLHEWQREMVDVCRQWTQSRYAD
jgi:pimeloyl-ACP methyl ester carboxylesterase